MKTLKLYHEADGFTSTFFKTHVAHVSTSIEDCDFVISNSFEFGSVDQIKFQKDLDSYINYKKRVIVFLISDYNNTLQVPDNVLLFRTSMYRSLKKDNEEVLAYIFESFDLPFTALKKTDKPIVGFCGDVNSNKGNRLRTISYLEKSDAIDTNFIKRNFFGAARLDLREEFIQNILNSHFTMANRGAGNFSIRFYQVLSLGRIPLLVDNETVFPFEDEIDWHSFIVCAKTEKKLIEKVKDIWDTKTDDAINEQLQKCKDIHDAYFTPTAYGKKMEILLQNELVSPRKINKNNWLFVKFPHQKYLISQYTFVLKKKNFRYV